MLGRFFKQNRFNKAPHAGSLPEAESLQKLVKSTGQLTFDAGNQSEILRLPTTLAGSLWKRQGLGACV